MDKTPSSALNGIRKDAGRKNRKAPPPGIKKFESNQFQNHRERFFLYCVLFIDV